jgi:UDP-N-acetylglucosamine acyltransferase
MIHETAIIDKTAEIHETVTIGPFCVIGEKVKIGEESVLYNNVTIEKNTTLGKGCKIWPYANVGAAPQDLSYNGEDTYLEVGDYTMIREAATISRGTVKEQGLTKIGSHCLLMAGAHVGHDCEVGNHVVIANFSGVTGHVRISDHVIVGGLSGIHQFTKVGEGVLLSGGTMCVQDIFPFTIAQGDRATIRGLNVVGMKRRNFSKDAMAAVKKAYKTYFLSDLPHQDAVAEINKQYEDTPLNELKTICDFLKISERGLARVPKE